MVAEAAGAPSKKKAKLEQSSRVELLATELAQIMSLARVMLLHPIHS